MFKLIKENIIPTIKPFYKEGNRQNICIGLSALLAKYNITPQETIEILTPLLETDPEKEQRIRGIWYTYETHYNGKPIQGYTLLKKIGINVDNFSLWDNVNNNLNIQSQQDNMSVENTNSQQSINHCGTCHNHIMSYTPNNDILNMLTILLELQKYRELSYFIRQLTPNKVNDAIIKNYDVNNITIDDILLLRKCEIMFDKNLLENIVCVVLAGSKNDNLKSDLKVLLEKYNNGSLSVADLYGKIRELKITFCISVSNLNKN